MQALEQQAAEPGFWDDPNAARKKMRTASDLRSLIEQWRGLARRAADALELAELEDESLRDELEIEATEVEQALGQFEFEQMLSGPHDHSNAILAIHSGAGGVDSMDFAAMLQRMYLRWGEQRHYNMEIIDQATSDEAGIKSATIMVEGRHAFGYLKAERGVHRLVRLSPFDSAHRRHTSFVLVEVYPELDDVDEVEVNSKDLKIDTFRASSAGGQHMQKNDTAVRITHLPSGIVVQCQNQRSQAQNRENAMKVLRSRLYQIKLDERDEQLSSLKGDYVSAEFGSQIRSYVLHPYQMVKDHRTNYETGNTTAVLDGGIDAFIDAYLRANLSNTPEN